MKEDIKLERFDLKKIDEFESMILEEVDQLHASFEAIAVSQSPFQTRHFVIAAHDTPERQWWQAVLELRVCLNNIRNMKLELEEKQLDIQELVRSYDRSNRYITEDLPALTVFGIVLITKKHKHIDQLKKDRFKIAMRRIEIDIEQITTSRMMNYRKAVTLFGIKKEIEAKCNGGKPFTYDQIMEAEADYWEKRLRRQAILKGGAGSVIGAGNAQALLELYSEPGEINPIHIDDNVRYINSHLKSMGLELVEADQPQLKEGDNGRPNK